VVVGKLQVLVQELPEENGRLCLDEVALPRKLAVPCKLKVIQELLHRIVRPPLPILVVALLLLPRIVPVDGDVPAPVHMIVRS
jgi:hypothetical protein